MSTFDGLPAHILLNHFVIVLTPLVAILAIICALWPAARRRLVWLVLALAVITVVLTPLTINAGEWLGRYAHSSPTLDSHMQLGETMIYFSAALLVAAVLLVTVHVRQSRGQSVKPVVEGLIVVLVVAAATASMVQIYRVGRSGAQSVWSNQCHCHMMDAAGNGCGCMAVGSTSPRIGPH